jgi:eukaryotic-like serine/threonine-protein kinase
MGTLWVARDGETLAPVAVKFSTQTLNASALRRFRREADALERLAHPNIVKLLGHGIEQGTPYIVMELLYGESLRGLIEHRSILAAGEALELLREAASGLATVHELGIVHRDVKPSNLFVCDSAGGRRTVKVIDFGIATGEVLKMETLSATSGLIGSPAYMSPEQARGEQVNHLTDVWALGVVAFQLLTGREPFAAPSLIETLQRICSGSVPRASALAEGLPAGVDELFGKAFARLPEQRFQSVGEFIAALEPLCQGAPLRAAVSLAPPAPAGRTLTTASYNNGLVAERPGAGSAWRGRGVAALLLAGAGLAGALWFTSQPSSDDATSPTAIVAPASAPPSAVSPAPVVAPLGEARPEPVSSVLAASSVPRPPLRSAARARPAAAAPRPPTPPVSSVSIDPVFGLPVSRTDARGSLDSHPAPRGSAGVATDGAR